MGIGSKIKELLKEKNKTIVWLADKSGLSKNTLYTITKRDDTTVKGENLKKIADALETTPAYLMGWKDEDFSHFQDILEEEGLFLLFFRTMGATIWPEDDDCKCYGIKFRDKYYDIPFEDYEQFQSEVHSFFRFKFLKLIGLLEDSIKNNPEDE